MKYWAIVVALLYAAILALVLVPLFWASFYFAPGASQEQFNFFALVKTMYGGPESIAYMGSTIMVFFLAQLALLATPVPLAKEKPATRLSIIPTLIASAAMMGLLIAGIALAINETAHKGAWNIRTLLHISVIGLLSWCLWGLIFYRWSKKLEPRTWIKKQCRCLLSGSILEFLIVVPAHILARRRDDCCGGIQTFFGMTFGIAVMLLSFGPGVFFLFAARWQHMHRKNLPQEPLQGK